MAQPELVCACGRLAADVLRVASEDGLLLVPLCEECNDAGIGTTEEQLELYGHFARRPLAVLPARDDRQPPLPLDELSDESTEQDVA